MVHIYGPFTVSKGSDTRAAIEDITPEGESRRRVRVDFYTWQTMRRDDGKGSFNCTAVFFGHTAETALNYLSPGRTVLLSGTLVQTTSTNGGKTYVNNDIYDAAFEFLPGGAAVGEEEEEEAEEAVQAAAEAPPARRPSLPPGMGRVPVRR